MKSRTFLPCIISNLIGILFISICYKYAKTGKIIRSIIFAAAGVFNIYTACTTPHVYVEAYGRSAVLPCYKNFIYGLFRQHTAMFVTLIASRQIIVAVLLLMKKILFTLGIFGGIVFLVAISPLGIGSAFPATLFMAVSLFLLIEIDMKTSHTK